MILAIQFGGATELRPTDRDLMTRLARRDPEALEHLYDKHSRIIYALLVRITQHPASADELLQEVFLRVWRNASAYQTSRGALTPWLLTMARNIAIDHLRSKGEKQRRQEDVEETRLDFAPVRTSARPAEEWLDQRRMSEKVRSLMDEFPQSQRQALELAYFEGMSQSEIARHLNEPLGTVKTWIRNGVLKLREKLEAVS